MNAARRFGKPACFAALALGLFVPLLDAGTVVIVAGRGRFATVEEAAVSEARVAWNDADPDDDTACTVGFAAVELARYLRSMSGGGDVRIQAPGAPPVPGAALAIRLAVLGELDPQTRAGLGLAGEAAASLGDEGYLLKTVRAGSSTALYIVGTRRAGVLYGAYDLLHRLGVRWFAPGEKHEEIPALDIEKLPDFDVRETPAFSLRGFHAWEDRADRDFLLWMARNRLNYWCVEQSDKPFLHKLGIQLVGGAHVLTSLYLGPRLEYPYDHPRFRGDEGKPADPYALSPEYRGDEDGDGRLGYFEAHPEWFGLQKGRRSARIEGDFGDNFCTSNPDATAEWNKNAVRDLIDGRYRDAGFMNAWALDVGTWCECDACRALGTPTDRNLLFVHAYAQAIKRARADGRLNRPVKLLFLAYADVLEPPTRALPADFDYETCIATYFPIKRCYVHRFDDPACPVNADFFKNLRGWALDPARHYQGHLCIGEYYGVSGYKCLPACYMTSMATDLPFYHASGARMFHYMHVTTGEWGSKALTNWQMARSIWDIDLSPEALWEDYFSGRYGAAAGAMRGFYRSLERMLSNVSELKYTLGRRLGALEKGEPLFPDAHLAYAPAAGQLGPSLLEILAAAADARKIIDAVRTRPLSERIVARLAEDERAFAYAERTLLFYDALCRAKMAVDAGSGEAAASALAEAQGLSEPLKADLSAARMGGTHSNAPNALDASYAAPALDVLARRIAGLAAPGQQLAGLSEAGPAGLLTYLAADGKPGAVRTPEDWRIRRAQIIGNFEKVAGPFPGAAKRVPLDVRVEGEQDLGDVIRKKLSYAAEPGDRVPAYLLVPKGLRGPAPAVLCPHQTNPRGKEEPAGIPGGNPDMAIALELARRGYVTLAPDYPGFGEYPIDVYAMGYASATMKGIWNHVRAVDLLQSLPEVDPDRIGCAGHSLGGHNSIFAALYDPRIKAVVTSCGFTAFPKYYGGDLTGWSHKGYMPRIASVYGKDPRRMPFDFPELLAALAPRPVFVNAPLRDENFDASGVDDCVRAARPVYALLGAGDAVTVLHPDVEHAFPAAEREAAWGFFDRLLRRR